jgi:hypothetical protein
MSVALEDFGHGSRGQRLCISPRHAVELAYMSKARTLTPAEEAQRAIDYQLDPDSLSEAALAEYDRLLEEGHYPPRSTIVLSPLAYQAQSRGEAGKKVFVARFQSALANLNLGNGEIPEVADAIEQAEAQGWHLESVMWVPRESRMLPDKPMAVALFRRPGYGIGQ